MARFGRIRGHGIGLGRAAGARRYVFQNIIDPANPTFTQALGINNAGTIVGYGNMTVFNGFQLVLPSTFTRENFPGATGGTQVVGIDAAGDTVGFYVNPDGSNHGFFKPPEVRLRPSTNRAQCSTSCLGSIRTATKPRAIHRSPTLPA